jgi:hypothetical protein
VLLTGCDPAWHYEGHGTLVPAKGSAAPAPVVSASAEYVAGAIYVSLEVERLSQLEVSISETDASLEDANAKKLASDGFEVTTLSPDAGGVAKRRLRWRFDARSASDDALQKLTFRHSDIQQGPDTFTFEATFEAR